MAGKKASGNAKKKRVPGKRWIAKLALDAIIAYYIVMFFLTFSFMGCPQTIGYPCFTQISSENKCYIGTKEGITPQTQIVAAINYFSDGTCGGSCDWRTTEQKTLYLPANGGLTIERDNGKPRVNGEEIGEGEKWSSVNYALNIDPWIIEEESIQLENSGVVNCVNAGGGTASFSGEEYGFLLVKGIHKISVKPNAGGIISFLVFLSLLACVERKNLKGKGVKEHLLCSTKFRIMAAMCAGISLFVAFTVL